MAFLAGLLLLALGWQLPRRAAGTRFRRSWALLLDLAMPGFVFTLLAGVSGRPIFAGIVTLSLGAGYAYAERAKRRTLDEPIVFTDVFQAIDVLRHPQLALPFPNKIPILIGALAVIAAYVTMYRLETPTVEGAPWLGLGVLAAAGVGTIVASGLLEAPLVVGMHSLGAIGDPARDAAHLGPLAMHLVHGFVARHERAVRRRQAPTLPPPPAGPLEGPVVVVQSESFFDARRLHPAIDRGLLPHFDHARRTGARFGRLLVPCWGANTVRTEFAVLTGIAPQALGFDHLNPYRRFVDAPVTSLASRFREMGCRTICLHPFDRRFYRRDVVMPHLGFDEFLGEEAFPRDAERIDGYISDQEVARVAVDLLDRHGPQVFLFIVTMENHGPWLAATGNDGLAAELGLPAGESRLLGRYLASLHNADRMLGTLMASLETGFRSGTLAFYGDHLPSLTGVYTHLKLTDRRADYAIWRPGLRRDGREVELEAHDLAAAILQAAE